MPGHISMGLHVVVSFDKVLIIKLSILLIVGISGFLQGCKTTPEKVIYHPNPEFLPKNNEVTHRVSLGNFDSLKPLPITLTKTGEIKAKEKTLDEYFFYQIPPKKIETDLGGNVYVLQNHTNSINVFNQTGKFLYKIGRKGNGPGEFRSINTFYFSGDYEKLYVLDNFKVETFTTTPDGFKHERTFLHQLQGSFDMCVLDNYLYISGYKISKKLLRSIEGSELEQDKLTKLKSSRISKPIHRYNRHTGEYEFEFGFLYETDSGIGPLGALLSKTMLSCNQKSKTVTGIIEYYPYIFGYDISGSQKWISKIEDFESIQSIETRPDVGSPTRPSLKRYSNTNIFNRYLPMRSASGEFLFVQTVFSLPQRDSAGKSKLRLPNHPTRTLLLDTYTGELSRLSYEKLIGTLNNNIFVEVENSNDNTAILSIYSATE